MTRRAKSQVWGWQLLMLMIWGSNPAFPEVSSEPTQVLTSYVLLAYSPIEGRTVPLVRTILAQPATACPSIVLDSGSPELAMRARPNPNPAAFGVLVCEAVVDIAPGVTARLAGRTLPVPSTAKMTVSRLVVVGDSGCKGGTSQICEATGETETAWPFPAIAASAAADRPDLVIHVGDYNYRGTPNKTGVGEWSYDGCLPADGGSLVRQSTYDTWETWNEDFFTPAAPLLAAAPWTVTRGNHELCSRAGQGWFYFLDPHSELLDPWVATPGCDAPTAPTQPYKLSFANLDLIMLDTANACGGEDPESVAGTAYEVTSYKLQLNTVNALLAQSANTAWLVGHRPLWSLYQSAPGSPLVSENQTLQPALAATLDGGLATAAQLVLSGHMHQFFSLTFTSAQRPSQLVIGNSGVKMSSNALPSPFNDEVDGAAATGLSNTADTAHGYLLVEMRDGGHWRGTVKAFDAAGKAQSDAVAVCALPIAADGELCQVP